MIDAAGLSPADYPTDEELGLEPAVAWCEACGSDHYHCPRCSSKACHHIVSLVKAILEEVPV